MNSTGRFYDFATTKQQDDHINILPSMMVQDDILTYYEIYDSSSLHRTFPLYRDIVILLLLLLLS